MDDGLKQRLIGAFVLFALAVIFVPIAFDRERIEPVDRTTQLPPPPEIDAITIEKAKPPELEEITDIDVEAPLAEEFFLPDETEIESSDPEPPSFAVDGTPNSWVLQVGSFRSSERAKKLRDQLISDGYDAYTRETRNAKGNLTRVFVGPKIEKNLLISSKNEIEKKYELSALLLKFEP